VAEYTKHPSYTPNKKASGVKKVGEMRWPRDRVASAKSLWWKLPI